MPAAAAPAAETTTETFAERVIAVIAKTQELDPADLALDTTFEAMGFDSLDGYEILFSLEEAFDVTIPDEDAQEVTSVREAVNRLRPLVEGGGGASDGGAGDAESGG